MKTKHIANKYDKEYTPDKSGKWFDELIATLNTHRILLETDLADASKKTFYDLMINGSDIDVAAAGNEMSKKYILRNMLIDYFTEITKRKINTISIAFNYTNSGLLVWAVINDDDEKSEDNLLLSAAKINAKYNKYGFSVSSTILEKSDNYPIPEHYKTIN